MRVAELFAGVGGFRVGFERASTRSKRFDVVWSNQWEPGTQRQHASEVYTSVFGKDGHSNEDIGKVPTNMIPDHDLLVGGFPCQDYSVARTLSQAEGLKGKKGVLWWQIHRILKEKKSDAPNFLMLENVDRLLKSPAKQRGRDFAVMLASLADLGYAVEWRVINAADYGMPQRRRRIYILGYKEGTVPHSEVSSSHPHDWLSKRGLFARSFPVISESLIPEHIVLNQDLEKISERFNLDIAGAASPFSNAGLMIDKNVWTIRTKPIHGGKKTTLGEILIPDEEVPKEYFVDEKSIQEWKYLKGAKKEEREGKNGFKYSYTEGPVSFPDHLDKPSRTIVTGEGGPTPSRFKHVVKTGSGRLRRLTPIELERLNMFPDNHTRMEGVSDVKRAFFMGNALVVGVIEKLGKELLNRAFAESPSPTKRSGMKTSRLSPRAPKSYKPSILTS